MQRIATLSLLVCFYLFTACNEKPEIIYSDYLPEEKALLDQYLNLPDDLDVYDPKFLYNMVNAGVVRPRLDRRKAVLGRVLFYDKNLSKDGTISCASCHKQELAFGDNKAVSAGVYGRTGERNALPLSAVVSFASQYGTDNNGTSALRFFWDNRSETAVSQIMASMSNPKEMDMHLDEIVAAVENQPFYSVLFEKAYGDPQVLPERVTEAIASFVNAMGSFQSRFDQGDSDNPSGYVETNFTNFTAAENRGKTVYLQNCATCHSSRMTQTALHNANNGLDAELTGDPGVGGITGISSDMGTFKVPTLRNIALSAPYMHDGRFQTLEQVVEHYNSGIQDHPNLSPALRTDAYGAPRRLNLTEAQKQDLVTFLYTLTDESMRTDRRFSNPFK